MKKLLFLLLLALLPLQRNETGATLSKEDKPLVTFIELGSVNCIPCKQMVPVMKSLEKRYRSKLKVVFYDVWTKEQKHYASMYKIRLIPTQIFLDKNGKEFHRHEGFYPEDEIDKILKSKGLKPDA